MLLKSLLISSLVTLTASSPINPIYFQKRDLTVEPECLGGNFQARCKQDKYPCANATVSDVKSIGDNIYNITLNFVAQQCADLSNLGELKIIGLKSPNGGTDVLFSRNSNVLTDVNPCQWSATFPIYGEQSGTLTCTPSFQIQYDWFSGTNTSTSDEATWKYKSSYDYSFTCSEDNQGNIQGDFPEYCWPAGSESTSSTSTSSKTKSTSTSKTTST